MSVSYAVASKRYSFFETDRIDRREGSKEERIKRKRQLLLQAQPLTHSRTHSRTHSLAGRQADMDPAVEAVLNVDVTKIEYGAALGQGAFGQVRAATYQGERVAVKAQDVDKDGEDFTYLVREMQIMVVVKHPNVLRLVGAGKEPLGGNRERYLLLMEICELGDLRKLWTRRFQAHRPLSWFQVTFILLGAARGIERLHSSGILHRDIKTENLLVHRGMVCKVADFGMSRQEAISEPAQMDNKHMTLCGTDEFMAPEVLFEEPYNFQADSFSFGVVLAEVCEPIHVNSTLVKVWHSWALVVECGM